MRALLVVRHSVVTYDAAASAHHVWQPGAAAFGVAVRRTLLLSLMCCTLRCSTVDVYVYAASMHGRKTHYLRAAAYRVCIYRTLVVLQSSEALAVAEALAKRPAAVPAAGISLAAAQAANGDAQGAIT